jgi:hypothetical protein
MFFMQGIFTLPSEYLSFMSQMKIVRRISVYTLPLSAFSHSSILLQCHEGREKHHCPLCGDSRSFRAYPLSCTRSFPDSLHHIDWVNRVDTYSFFTVFRWSVVGWGTATNRKVAGSIPGEVIGLFNWPNPSIHTMPLGSTAICEPIVWKMWVPRHITTLWASTARYSDRFT